MLILTAYTEELFSEIGELCCRSVRNHLSKVGKHHFISEIIPPEYSRKPSWFKVEAIQRHLKDHDVVFWIDSDAMILGELDILPQLQEVPLNICRDSNGINHGIVAWRNCPESFTALRLMDNLYPTYQTHKWYEQAALMSFVNLVPHHILPKHIFNAYPSDRTEDSQIVHFPGTPNNKRLRLMKQIAKENAIP